jgi:hypothetical protein
MVSLMAIAASAVILSLFCCLVARAVKGHLFRHAGEPISRSDEGQSSTSAPRHAPTAHDWATLEVRNRQRQLHAAEREARKYRRGWRDPAALGKATLRTARREVRARRSALNAARSPADKRKQRAALRQAVNVEKAARQAFGPRRTPFLPPQPDTARAIRATELEMRMRREALKNRSTWREAQRQRAALQDARVRRDALQRATQADAANDAVRQSRAALRRASDHYAMLRATKGQASSPRITAPPEPREREDAVTYRRPERVTNVLRILAFPIPPAEQYEQIQEWRSDGSSHRTGFGSRSRT